MNSTMTYEKPTMTFVSLRSEDAVANTCWGHHGTGYTYYYDLPGTGYLSFQIGEGPCDLNLVSVLYYDDIGATPSSATPEQVNTLYNAIIASSTGAAANSYKGLGSTILPNPDPSWS
ncbi:MAG TPA: hypothetical protein IAC15_10985 [Candidatus Onthomonas avicola]|nr:hypothetical protein [Candidatus Onthomonas avicola]